MGKNRNYESDLILSAERPVFPDELAPGAGVRGAPLPLL